MKYGSLNVLVASDLPKSEPNQKHTIKARKNMTEDSKELAISLHGAGGVVENIYYETISRTTTLRELKQRLPEENLVLSYNHQTLPDDDAGIVLWNIFTDDDANPVLAAHFPAKPISVLLHFRNKNLSEQVLVTTVDELKSSVQQILKSKAGGGILVDLQCNAQSLLSNDVNNDTLVSTLASSEKVVVVDVVVGGGTFPISYESQPSAQEPAFFTRFVDAQFTKDRMSKLNDMNFNNLVLAGAIEHVSSLPQCKLRYSHELDILMKTHQQASELLLKAMDMYASRFALGGSKLHHRTVQPETEAAAAAAAAQPVQQDVGAVDEQRAVRRRQLLMGMDLGLLVKLVVIVLLMGYDSGAQEFTLMCTVATLIYIVNIGLIRVPVLVQQWLGMRGRIPHQRRAGFFVDLYTVVISFLLSIIPIWTVQGEGEEEEHPQPQAAAAAAVEPVL